MEEIAIPIYIFENTLKIKYDIVKRDWQKKGKSNTTSVRNANSTEFLARD